MSMTESIRSVPGTKPIATKVVQNTAVLLTGRIATALLGGASSILIARCLGIEQLGEFSSLYAYVSLFVWLATLGIESVLTRESARWRERSSSIIATGVALCGFFAIAVAVFVILFAPHAGYRGKMQMLVVFAAIELLVFAPLRLAGAIFQVELKQWYGTGIILARQILWLLIIILLARARGSLMSFVLGRLSAAAVETVLILAVSARFLKPPRRIIVQDFKVYLRACIPIALSMLLASVYLRVDQVMLHRLASDKILGFYAAAVKVSELFEMLPAALLSSVFPILAMAANDKQRMAVYTNRIFRYLMVAAGLLCTLVCVGSELIVHTLYGPQFGPSAHLLSILIWSEFAVFFGCKSSFGAWSTELPNISDDRRRHRQRPAKPDLDPAVRSRGLGLGNISELYVCLGGFALRICRHARYGVGGIAEGGSCGVAVCSCSGYCQQLGIAIDYAAGDGIGTLWSRRWRHQNY